jgi:hypothetical protein
MGGIGRWRPLPDGIQTGGPHPDFQAAQLYATLSLEEAVREAVAELAHLTRALVAASRR